MGPPVSGSAWALIRDFTAKERKAILASLKARPTLLLLEYNLNPTPRYTEWGGKSTHYLSGNLVPYDMAFFEACIEQGSKSVVSTDAHDVGQTARLTAQTDIPQQIKNRLIYFR